MAIFWIICSLLIIVALIIVMPALLSKETAKDIDRKKINRTVFEKKLIELENDRNNDLIDQEQYLIAKTDLERSLLDDLENQQELTVKTNNKLLPIIIVIALHIQICLLVYALIGLKENGSIQVIVILQVINML